MLDKHIIICYKIEFFGRVQGVGFRMLCCKMAREYNINGTVKNRADGAVEVICEGSEQMINRFIIQCKKGNGWSGVTSIKKHIQTKQHFETFKIIV